MFSLENKIAVITGGGSGIGRAISILFATQKAEVHILEVNEKNAAETIHEIKSAGGKAELHICNVVDQQQIKNIFQNIDTPDILVNNAAIAHIGKAHTTKEEDFERLMQVNVKGVYNCLYASIPQMLKRGGGVILNVSSVAAVVALADRFAYSATKGAVAAMTMSVAKDYVNENIRCNSISPARVHTPFVDDYLSKNYPGREAKMFEELSRTQPVGRMGNPEEIASLALYLCSDEASFITGCDYLIDGGFVKLK
jgi:NAD(P)-dependent dehydrogenase (short-subunit alcohol dehydrogenase family)